MKRYEPQHLIRLLNLTSMMYVIIIIIIIGTYFFFVSYTDADNLS